LHLSVDANGGVRRAACNAQKAKDPPGQDASRRPLPRTRLHVVPSPWRQLTAARGVRLTRRRFSCRPNPGN
jgi:hypothetical protein